MAEEKVVGAPCSRYDQRLASRIRALTLQLTQNPSRNLWLMLGRAAPSNTPLDPHNDWHLAMAELLQTISTAPDMRELLLWGDRVNDDVAAMLAEDLSNLSLIDLHIRHGHLSKAGTASLMTVVAQNQALQKLTLYNLGIDTIAVLSIAQIIETNTSICHLNLALNDFGSEGAAALATSLIINKTLTCLTLGDYGKSTEIDDNAAVAFAEMLRVNSSLTELNLYNNHVTILGIESLREALTSNSTIKKINCKENRVTAAQRSSQRRAFGVNLFRKLQF